MDMLSFSEALRVIARAAEQISLSDESVELADAPGRICAETLRASIDNQPFDNAAMDGFAVLCADLQNATKACPVSLHIEGTLAAGDHRVNLPPLRPGQCWRIMTGAPLVPQSEAIVPVEQTHSTSTHASFSAPALKQAHIRRKGEDFRKGAPLLEPGTTINSAHILPLATAGIARLRVKRRLRALFLSTGKELRPVGDTDLQPSQIYDSNGAYAQRYLRDSGFEVQAHRIGDDGEAFAALLRAEKADAFDVVVSSGAVSAGLFDFIPETLRALGGNIHYRGLYMRPGKPNLFAQLPRGSLYFGLPGNPVACAAGLRFFIETARRTLLGLGPEQPLRLALDNAYSKKPGWHMLLKAALQKKGDDPLRVRILDGQQSFKVAPFLHMDGWISVVATAQQLLPDTYVSFFPSHPG